MNKLMLSTGFLLIALWHSSAGAASGLPDYYPGAFAQWGVITNIDVATGQVVIGDLPVQVDPGARIYTTNTRHETLHGLRIGMRVAYGPGGARTPGAITELWVLPANHIPVRTPR